MHTSHAFARLVARTFMIVCICLDHDTISKATTVDDEEEVGKKSNVRFLRVSFTLCARCIVF
jgi:hypothetical protein